MLQLVYFKKNTKYFNAVAILQEKILDAFNLLSKSINESNDNITEDNKTLTESINKLFLAITTTSNIIDSNFEIIALQKEIF